MGTVESILERAQSGQLAGRFVAESILMVAPANVWKFAACQASWHLSVAGLFVAAHQSPGGRPEPSAWLGFHAEPLHDSPASLMKPRFACILRVLAVG